MVLFKAAKTMKEKGDGQIYRKEAEKKKENEIGRDMRRGRYIK